MPVATPSDVLAYGILTFFFFGAQALLFNVSPCSCSRARRLGIGADAQRTLTRIEGPDANLGNIGNCASFLGLQFVNGGHRRYSGVPRCHDKPGPGAHCGAGLCDAQPRTQPALYGT